MLKSPDCVGVPSRMPVAECRVRPVGSVLAVVKAGGPRLPLCVNCSLNGEATVPLVFTGFVTEMALQAMTRLYVAPVPVQPFASVTVTTIGKVPCCVVVPDRTPAVESEKPVGSVEAVVNVAGVCVPTPLCVKVWL